MLLVFSVLFMTENNFIVVLLQHHHQQQQQQQQQQCVLARGTQPRLDVYNVNSQAWPTYL